MFLDELKAKHKSISIVLHKANLPNRYSVRCWRPVTHAQTWASYRALYRFGRLSLHNLSSDSLTTVQTYSAQKYSTAVLPEARSWIVQLRNSHWQCFDYSDTLPTTKQQLTAGHQHLVLISTKVMLTITIQQHLVMIQELVNVVLFTLYVQKFMQY